MAPLVIHTTFTVAMIRSSLLIVGLLLRSVAVAAPVLLVKVVVALGGWSLILLVGSLLLIFVAWVVVKIVVAPLKILTRILLLVVARLALVLHVRLVVVPFVGLVLFLSLIVLVHLG